MSKQNICNEKAATELLPPPPFRCKSPRLSAYVPLPFPPCAFQPSPSSQLVRTRQEEDPFYAAYLECTKSVQESNKIKKREPGFSFSCKHAGCGVRDEAVVSLSRFRQLGNHHSSSLHSNWVCVNHHSSSLHSNWVCVNHHHEAWS